MDRLVFPKDKPEPPPKGHDYRALTQQRKQIPPTVGMTTGEKRKQKLEGQKLEGRNWKIEGVIGVRAAEEGCETRVAAQGIVRRDAL